MPTPDRMPRPLAALDDLRRWRPILPTAVIERVLRRDRGGVYPAHPDPRFKAPSYSQRSIERTRVALIKTQALADPAPRALEQRTIQLPHCTAEHLRLPESRPGHVLLYFHGGAYLRGSTATHIGAITRFMRAARCEGRSVDYRMAPEFHFPAWTDDALDAYRGLLGEGVDPARIALGGDSAGGGLVLALIQLLHQHGLPQPAAAFLVSPWADFTFSGPSHAANEASEAMFGPGVIAHAGRWLAEQAGVPVDHPLLSPAHGTYPADAPPLRIDVSAREALRSDADGVAEAYRAGGGTVELVEDPRAPHAWTAMGSLRAARRTAREIGAFLDAHWR